jgi:hypothetical protein
MSKINKRRKVEVEEAVVVEAAEIAVPQKEVVQTDEKGRFKVVQLSMVEWDDIIKSKGLKTKSAMIRHLIGEGYSPSAVAKFLDVIYQHVRNVMHQQLKRPVAVVAPPEEPNEPSDEELVGEGGEAE